MSDLHEIDTIPVYFDCWEHQGSRSTESILINAIFDELDKKIYNNNFLELYLDSIKDQISNLDEEQIKAIVVKSSKFILILNRVLPVDILDLPKLTELFENIIPESMKIKIDCIKEICESSFSFIFKQTKFINENKNKKEYEEYNNLIINEHMIEHEFYQIIHELLFFKNKKVLLIFDELDRCEPNYAMDLLKKIMYINKKFTQISENSSYNILISVNKNEFIHIMKHYYGEKYSDEVYFDKLFDYEFELPFGDNYKKYFNENKLNYDVDMSCLNKNIKTLLDKDNYRKNNQLVKQFNKFTEMRIVKNLFDGIDYYNQVYLQEIIFSIFTLKIYDYAEYHKVKEDAFSYGKVVESLTRSEDKQHLIRLVSGLNVALLQSDINIKNLNEINKDAIALNNIKLNTINDNTVFPDLNKTEIVKDYVIIYILFRHYNI